MRGEEKDSMLDFSMYVVLGSLGVMLLLGMVIRPVFAAVAVVSFAFISPYALPIPLEAGALHFRCIDIVSGILICIVLMQFAVQRDITVLQEFRAFYVPLLPFLLYIGISLANVGFTQPNILNASLASYIRLISTALLAPLLYLSVRNKHDLRILHTSLILFGIASVLGSALERQYTQGVDAIALNSERISGSFLSINTFGLVSGLLVVYALIKGDGQFRTLYRVIPLVCGLMGLFLAKSASSALATAGASALYLSIMRARSESTVKWLRWGVVGVALLVVTVLAIRTWRQNDTIGLANVSSGSFAHRFMIAHAGLWIFLDHPFIGVGWQASVTEAFLHSPVLNAALMQKFPELPKTYFLEGASQLHNMYIHILAELGIVGFGLFIYACLHIGKAVIGLLRSLRYGSPYIAWAQFYALGLVVLLIWWNHSPLYGGQTESYLAFIFLAALATVARLERSERQQG
jgi:O-antigen ligase